MPDYATHADTPFYHYLQSQPLATSQPPAPSHSSQSRTQPDLYFDTFPIPTLLIRRT